MSAVPARETKSILLRLDRTLAGQVEAVAAVEGRSTSDAVRAALAEFVERRRQDPRFSRLLQENLERHEALLRSLTDDEP